MSMRKINEKKIFTIINNEEIQIETIQDDADELKITSIITVKMPKKQK